MKKLIFTYSLLLLSLLLSQTTALAQCFEDPNNPGKYVTPTGDPCPNAIVSAVPFLRIVGDARSGGMGDAGIGISPDPNAMHFNASKLAFAQEDFAISATYTPWLRALGLQDVYLAYLTGYKKLDDNQAVGVGLRYFSMGSINFTDANGEPLGTGRPNEFELTGAYARKLGERLSAAIAAKFIYSNLAAGQQVNGTGEEIEPGLAGAADISFTYEAPIDLQNGESILRIGAAASNIGNKITYTNSVNRDFLPQNLGLGAAWEMDFDQYNKFTIALDLNKALVPTPCIEDCDPNGNGIPDFKEESPIGAVFTSFGDAPGGFSEELSEISYSVGAEYWYDEQFAVRAGYYYEDLTKGNRKFLTMGLGVKYNVFGLNFSYLVPTNNVRNPLDNTLRFTLMFDFGALETTNVN